MDKNNKSAYLFILPHLIIFGIFFAIPAVFGIYVSFTKWNLYSSPQWVGLENYYNILINSDSTFYQQFHNGLKNTLSFALFSVPFCIAVPLLFAVLLNAKPRGHKIFQSIFYLPTLFSISAVVLTWSFMFNKNMGIVNKLLGLKVAWTSTQPYTWIALVAITVWWCIGSNMVIYQAALASVPKEIYEAAKMDGSSGIRTFFCISLPNIKDQLLYTVVMTTIAQFNVYGQPLMFSNGAPKDTTRVLLMYIQQLAFGTGESVAGIAASMAVMLGLCIMLVSLIQAFVLTEKDNRPKLHKKVRN